MKGSAGMRLDAPILVCVVVMTSCGGQPSSEGMPSPGDTSGGAATSIADASSTGALSSGGSLRDSGAPAEGNMCTPAEGSGIFTAPNVWMRDVSCDPVDPSSNSVIDALTSAGGWGPGIASFQIDTSLVVLHADATTPMVPFFQAKGYYTPDCDTFSMLPLPPAGAIEGAGGYTCDTTAGDCHLLVVHPPSGTLYEIYQATSQGAGIVGSCGVLWSLAKTYPDNLRGDQCTSADAAGFPLAAMLADADEVASGAVLHAMRFALPNNRIRAGVYVHPASHAGGPSGGPTLPPYGVRMRLRADYPIASLPSVAARVLATALQRFGMLLSDAGNIPLMVQSDQFTTHRWKEVNFDPHMFFGVKPADFEVVDSGSAVPLTYQCVRNP